jgi:hypothetical protein
MILFLSSKKQRQDKRDKTRQDEIEERYEEIMILFLSIKKQRQDKRDKRRDERRDRREV